MVSKKRDLEKTKHAPLVAALPLLHDLRQMIDETRQGVAATVNAALTSLYWRIGKRINEEILRRTCRIRTTDSCNVVARIGSPQYLWIVVIRLCPRGSCTEKSKLIHAAFAFRLPSIFKEASINAGISVGCLLVTRLPSTTTSLSI